MLPANAICVSPQQQTLQACWEEAHNALYSSYPSCCGNGSGDQSFANRSSLAPVKMSGGNALPREG
jgi:hypothetical protein